jgi:hypothetical protein
VGRKPQLLHVLPQVWFRNTWNWFEDASSPSLRAVDSCTISGEHETLGSFTVHFETPQDLLFCDNETNAPKLFGATDIHGFRLHSPPRIAISPQKLPRPFSTKSAISGHSGHT